MIKLYVIENGNFSNNSKYHASKILWECYVAIPVFNQSRPGQRINSLHVIEIDSVYRNPHFKSIPLEIYQEWGSRKRNYLLRDVQNNCKRKYINSKIINI